MRVGELRCRQSEKNPSCYSNGHEVHYDINFLQDPQLKRQPV